MIFVAPYGFFASTKGEDFAAAQFGAGGFHEEGTAAAWADCGVDLGEEILRKNDVYPWQSHGDVPKLLDILLNWSLSNGSRLHSTYNGGQMRRIFLLLMLASSWSAHAQEPVDLVRQTARHYRELSRYELRGTLTADFVGSTWQLAIDAGVVGLGGAAKSGADRAPDLVLYNEMRFVDLQPTRGTVAPKVSVGMPPLGFFSKMDKDALSVQRFGDEAMAVGGKKIVCWHLSVLYDERPDDPIPKNVEYWVDPAEHIVLRERFLGRSGSGGAETLLWTLTATSEKLGDDAPEPPALPPPGPEFVVKTELIGRAGPEFQLRELSGTAIDLKAMRGHAVLLDFWSVTCGPCVREMPTVERLAGEYAAKGLEVWGISKDDAETDRRWLRKKGYGLRTLTDGDGAVSTLYKVEGIPVMVLIGRDGKVTQSWLGTPPEGDFRKAIKATLR